MEDNLVIAGKFIKNRFFLGTGKFSSNQIMKEAIIASGVELVTVALRRVDDGSKAGNIMDFIPKNCIVMLNTSGARNAEEAVRIARIGKTAGLGNWVKIEIISDNKFLLPDNLETIRATEILSKDGFVVMPYMNPDLMDAKRLKDAGAASVMPLGSPIGTGKGLETKELIRILIDEIDLPVVVDAGIGVPSHAAQAMELGAAAVLANTAVAVAGDPVAAARAFSLATEAGRLGFLSNLQGERNHAQASSPLTGFLR